MRRRNCSRRDLIFGIAPAPCLALLWLIYLSLATVGRISTAFNGTICCSKPAFSQFFLRRCNCCQNFHRHAAVANRSLAAAFAAVQADVFIRLREIVERRPELAQSHRADVPLSNAAAANMDCLVCEPIAALVPKIFLRRDVCHRTWRAVADFRATTNPVPRRRSHHRSLQILILLTGNYTFFNFLTLALCLLLLDDFVFQKILPRNVSAFRQFTTNLKFLYRRVGWPKTLTIPRWRL